MRTYADKLEDYFDKTSFAIYKGESDDEDLSHLSDDEIWEKLKDRIYDSTVTIVLISPNMKELYRSDKSQWIPWEISYSLKETTRKDRTSRSNAILAVVLPDKNNSYSYFLGYEQCYDGSYKFNFDVVFDILRKNMLNKKISKNCYYGVLNYDEEHSYIKTVKWSEFIREPLKYINIAIDIKSHIDEYNIVKEI